MGLLSASEVPELWLGSGIRDFEHVYRLGLLSASEVPELGLGSGVRGSGGGPPWSHNSRDPCVRIVISHACRWEERAPKLSAIRARSQIQLCVKSKNVPAYTIPLLTTGVADEYDSKGAPPPDVADLARGRVLYLPYHPEVPFGSRKIFWGSLRSPQCFPWACGRRVSVVCHSAMAT